MGRVVTNNIVSNVAMNFVFKLMLLIGFKCGFSVAVRSY